MFHDPYIQKPSKKSIYSDDKYYLTKTPCIRGHISKRHIINGTCVACTREQWKRVPKEKRQFYGERYRSRKHGNGGSHTFADIVLLLSKQKNNCVNCLMSLEISGYHIDHIVSISKGGSDNICNIQLLCPTCNHRKSNKDPFDFARENGRLL